MVCVLLGMWDVLNEVKFDVVLVYGDIIILMVVFFVVFY